MKIINIAPCAIYSPGWSYQENLLPRYQAALGHDVILLTTTKQHSGSGFIVTDQSDTQSEDGFRVIRRNLKYLHIPFFERIVSCIDVSDILNDEKPDFIFYHGLVDVTIFQVKTYIKKVNPNCVLVLDNHLDPNIGFPKGKKSTAILKLFYRMVYKYNNKYVSKVYGVTPWRAEYAHSFFGVPRDKIDVLIMGADDEKIDFANRNRIRNSLRYENHLKDEDFVIVTGGKIDKKKRIIELMKAVNCLPQNIHLVIFGTVLDDVLDDFNNNLSEKIHYIGWIEASKCYDYFFMSDLVVFPGQHSVLWEQACASKTPCLFALWPGMQHVDNGGNSEFIENPTEINLKERIIDLAFTERYYKMLRIAQSDITNIYLYSHIAAKSIECSYRRII